jgi:flagellin-like hook-associated protein FlgL
VSSISLGNNLASMNAIRRFGQTSAELSGTYERLSSGLRINHASDDAAGLAIASSLKTDARVYTQAVRNVNDGISYLNVADGATGALTNILLRIRELSTQASNGTYSDKQRQALDQENLALQGEVNRIIDTTQFNGINVFSSGTLNIQAGYGQDGTLSVSLGQATTTGIGDGTFQASQSFATGGMTSSIVAGDYNGDSKMDLASVSGTNLNVLLGNGDGTFQTRQQLNSGNSPETIANADFNGDGKLDLVSADNAGNTVSVLLGNGNGTFQASVSFVAGTSPEQMGIADFNGDGKQDIVTADSSTLSVLLGNGDGTFQARMSYATSGSHGVAVGDFNGDNKMDLVSASGGGAMVAEVLLGNGDGTFQARTSFITAAYSYSVAVADFNGDAKLDFVTSGSTPSVLIGNGNGTFLAVQTFGTGSTVREITVGDFNGDGKPDFVDTGNPLLLFLNNGNGTFRTSSVNMGSAPRGIATADVNSDGRLDLLTADTNNTVSVLLGNGTTTTVSGLQHISGISLATQSSALTAQGQIDSYLDNVSQVQGLIGSSMSRFATAVSNLQNLGENLSSAASQIMDADVAEESAKLVRNQILQQATASVLAQANQQPALALKLLSA